MASFRSGDKMDGITNDLKNIYTRSIRPIEETYNFGDFFTPCLEDSDFDTKPMVLLLGQYSVGKTTFIQHLVKRDFSGMHVGPEPTTDKFIAVMEGSENKVIPGNAATVDSTKPFRSLVRFGEGFLNKFEVSENVTTHGANILKDLNFIDTPGVLSGEKQRIGRDYDYPSIVKWFANRSDRILLLFDAHKLDISDEFNSAIKALAGNDEKIRIILNKSDSVNAQQLMRVYGALMWSLGKVFGSAEVPRVYIGSFWDKPLDPNHECLSLFKNESQDLINDLKQLPRGSAIRKVNELVKRARLVRVHALILAKLKSTFSTFTKKSKNQAKILNDLQSQFAAVSTKYNIPPADFPNAAFFRQVVENKQMDLSKFKKLSEKAMKRLEHVINTDIPEVMNRIPEARMQESIAERQRDNPFSTSSADWPVTNEELEICTEEFKALPLNEKGRLGASSARSAFAKESSGLSNDVLFKIWNLSDVDKDNELSVEEFALFKHLLKKAHTGEGIPEVLPKPLIPPRMR